MDNVPNWFHDFHRMPTGDGMANVCMEKGGELLLSSIYISFKAIKVHSRVGKQHLSITTRPIQSTTVIYYDDAKYSDASMFWKSQVIPFDGIPLRPRSSAATSPSWGGK